MSNFKLKATHAPVKAYYETLERFGRGENSTTRETCGGPSRRCWRSVPGRSSGWWCPSTRLHVEYEKQEEYPLELTETGKLDWRVEKMALSKDKTQLKYNEFLTLSGIPAEAYEYRPGNRSALEWVVDQYRVSADARSGIVNDPNREDDPEYIVRLVGQVVTVSVETVRLVWELAGLGIEQA